MLKEYAYLILSLAFLGLFIGGLVISPRRIRGSIVLSAFLSAPISFASLIFVPGYWNPNRIIHFIIGPEDFIFSFSTGGIAWLTAVWFVRHKTIFTFEKRTIVSRYIKFIVMGSIIDLLFLMMNVGIMFSTVITIAILGLWILFKRVHYWIISIGGLIGFTVCYLILLKLGFTFFPDFIYQWNFENFCGLFIWGIPFEEIVWSMACGSVWPLITAYLFNAQLAVPNIPLDRMKIGI